jgi:probable HAF family extracellular repeat protein
MTHRAIIGALALLAAAEQQALAQQHIYHVRDLGTLAGPTRATAINSAGKVTGFTTDAQSRHRAFAWDGSLNAFDPLIGDSLAIGYAIDAQGHIVGASFDLGETVIRSFREQGGSIVSLGAFTARGVSPAGSVVGYLRTTGLSNTSVDHACRLDSGVLTDLGTLGGADSYAYAVNTSGQIVGLSWLAGDQQARATLWQGSPLQRRDLGTIGGARSIAYAINDSRLVAGGSQNAAGNWRAVRFELDSTGAVLARVDLGALPSGSAAPGASMARGLNNSGVCVGVSSGTGFVHHGDQMRDLNALLAPEGTLRVTAAWAINDSGHIAASGLGALGEERAFVLIPCDADVDRDGGITVPDIFEFLRLWFAGAAAADFDGNGTIAVPDIFAYLSAWFAGCAT